MTISRIAHRALALVLVAPLLSGCTGILVMAGVPGVVPDKDFKQNMTRAEVEAKLGSPIAGLALSYGRLEYYDYEPPISGNAKGGLTLIGDRKSVV